MDYLNAPVIIMIGAVMLFIGQVLNSFTATSLGFIGVACGFLALSFAGKRKRKHRNTNYANKYTTPKVIHNRRNGKRGCRDYNRNDDLQIDSYKTASRANNRISHVPRKYNITRFHLEKDYNDAKFNYRDINNNSHLNTSCENVQMYCEDNVINEDLPTHEELERENHEDMLKNLICFNKGLCQN